MQCRLVRTKVRKMTARRSILEVIWVTLGVKLAPSLTSEGFFLEVRILVEKRCLAQSPGAPESPRERVGAGGGSLKEPLETGG